jgi:hypothetical protein
MLIYLSSPYSDQDQTVREYRHIQARRFVARELLDNNRIIFSPIVHYHELAQAEGLPGSFEFWQPVNRHFIENSETLIVLRLPGWQDSIGVHAEVEIAIENGLLIEYADPVT